MYRGEQRRTHPGCLVILNPGEVHTGQPESETGWFYRDLYISIPLMEKTLDELGLHKQGLPFFPQPIIDDKDLWASLSNLFFTLYMSPNTLHRESQLLFALAKLVNKHADQKYTLRSEGRENKAIAKVKEYIEAHYASEISIDELSRLPD